MKTELKRVGNTYPNIETQRTLLISSKERLQSNIIKEIGALHTESGYDGVALLIDAMHNLIISEIDMYKDCDSTPSIERLYELARDINGLGNIAKRLSRMLHSVNYLDRNKKQMKLTNMGVLL